MPWTVHENGWVSVSASVEAEQKAMRLRAQRDEQYGNIFDELETDCRWVGELGEAAFNAWLRRLGCANYEWIQDEAAGKPDFIVRGRTVGVKTVKRVVSPREDYTAQVSRRHANEPVDDFFFLSYDLPRRRMWLLGGIARPIFLGHADLLGPGARVHPGYTVRAGHWIYNGPINRLTTPNEWFDSIFEE